MVPCALAGHDDITAVVACFNHGGYLREAIASVRSQAGGPPRTIVVDDGSTDTETLSVLESLEGDVEVIQQPNRGVCAARNAGLDRVMTAYALVLDGDDRLAPGALQSMRAPLDADPALGFAYGLMRMFGDWEGVLRFPPYDPYKLLYRHTVGLSALMRRELVADTGGFDPDFSAFEDWELWLHALACGWRGRRVDAVTLEYRRHAGGSKLADDRRRYRGAFRQLRIKHAPLYRDRAQLAADSELGAAGRAFYRFFWGHRVVPAVVERGAHQLLFGARGSR